MKFSFFLLAPLTGLVLANNITEEYDLADYDDYEDYNGLSERSDIFGRAVNSACTGASSKPGVCISTSSCKADGGTYVSGKCPGTPNNIKCCTKPKCGSGGNCRFTSSCSTGNTKAGLCPGPANFKCCLPKKSTPAPITGVPAKVLAKAKTAKGIRYTWGGGSCSGPTGSPKGYDCSGLVSWAVCKVTGRNLFKEGLRVTREMYCASESKRKFKKVPFSQRKAGDAVFFGGGCNCATSKGKAGIHHVGLMMDSGWRMWNALKTGTNVREDNFKNWKGTEAPCPYVIRFH